jgi:hypothetical protein
MTQQNESQTQPNQPVSLAKPIVIGAAIGLILISFFVFGVDHPNPAWGKLWMIKPLVIVPLAGASGGAFYYFMAHLNSHSGLNKTVAIVLSLMVYIIALWLGTVLGLNGTMWD